MRSFSYLIIGAMTFWTVGCGNLSKEKAREILQQKHYDQDNNVNCEWKEFVSQESSGITVHYSVSDTSDTSKITDSMKALSSLGVIKNVECVDRSRSGCLKAQFDLGPSTSVQGARMSLPCGTKTLGEVTSVATEGKTATVRYKRTVKLNHNVIEALSALILDIPKEGEEELARKFVKDDDGNWSDVSK
jgi:hypothetical protein